MMSTVLATAVETAAPTIRDLLHRFATSWPRRAQVKQEDLEASLLDDAKDDFIPSLLPFQNHELFETAPSAMRSKILSCGWLAYNEKTVDIEAKIINPACLHVVYGEVPGLRDGASREIASQTLVDEAYHILLVGKANEVTRRHRGLGSLAIPRCNLVRQMRVCQAMHREDWQRMLIQLATAIVSEVFISDYLRLLSQESSIPSFNRMTVWTHRRDELAHAPIFRTMTKLMYGELNRRERAFFISVLPKPVRWFADAELDVWLAMLEQIGFAGAAMMIDDCRSAQPSDLSALDYSGVISLAGELGMLDTQLGIDSFSAEGLIAATGGQHPGHAEAL
jgi:hypothetical protein